MPSVERQARTLWRGCVRQWKKQAENYTSRIAALPDGPFRFAVLHMTEALSSERGCFNVGTHNIHKSTVENIDLDDDVIDDLLDALEERGVDDPEDLIERASHWMLTNLHEIGVSMGFLGWAFGSIIFDDEEGNGKFSVSDGGVVYRDGKLRGVLVKDRHGNRIIPMDRLT